MCLSLESREHRATLSEQTQPAEGPRSGPSGEPRRNHPISCRAPTYEALEECHSPVLRARLAHNVNGLHSARRKTGASTTRVESNSRTAICYRKRCRTGNSSPALLGVPQWTRTLSTGQEYNCMSHHSVSFTQCQRRLPFEILTSGQKRTRFKYTCSVSWTAPLSPSPTTNLSRSYNCRDTSIPSPHHLKLSSHWKRKTVGNILGLNYVCPSLY